MIDKILWLIGIIIVLPTLAFLCMKLGTVGFYKGKEAVSKENNKSEMNNCNEKTEN